MSYSANKSCDQYSTKLNSIVMLTVVCLLSVLILHHPTYTLDYLSPIRKFYVHDFLQKFAVGGFIFLSGFKMAKSKASNTIKEFLINRFLKIYPLYLLALILFSFIVYPDFNNDIFPSWKNFVLHAFAFQSIFPDLFQANYHTIWFISIIFICYGFFLLLRRFLDNLGIFFLLSFVICLAIPALRHLFSLLGLNIFQVLANKSYNITDFY